MVSSGVESIHLPVASSSHITHISLILSINSGSSSIVEAGLALKQPIIGASVGCFKHPMDDHSHVIAVSTTWDLSPSGHARYTGNVRVYATQWCHCVQRETGPTWYSWQSSALAATTS